MNQQSSIGFGSDATLLAGYAQSTNNRLGNIDFVFENTGSNQAYIKLAQYDGTTSPSGYANVGNAFTVVPRGTVTRSYTFLGKRIGFFGSGNTKVNISTVIRNKGDLRGAQIDIVATGRRSWGYDQAFNKSELVQRWGFVTPVSTSGNTDAGQGNINFNAEGV